MIGAIPHAPLPLLTTSQGGFEEELPEELVAVLAGEPGKAGTTAATASTPPTTPTAPPPAATEARWDFNSLGVPEIVDVVDAAQITELLLSDAELCELLKGEAFPDSVANPSSKFHLRFEISTLLCLVELRGNFECEISFQLKLSVCLSRLQCLRFPYVLPLL